MQQLNFLKNNRSYISLISVIIIFTVLITVSTFLLQLGTDRRIINKKMSDRIISQINAEHCMDTALDALKTSIQYTGNQTISINGGTCQILPITGSGNTNRKIQVVGNYNNFVKRIEVFVTTVNPTTNIWYKSDYANFP